jgi:hypothetical protein
MAKKKKKDVKKVVEQIKSELERLEIPGIVMHNKDGETVTLFANIRYIPDVKLPDDDRVTTLPLTAIDKSKAGTYEGEDYDFTFVNTDLSVESGDDDESKDATDPENNPYISRD